MIFNGLLFIVFGFVLASSSVSICDVLKIRYKYSFLDPNIIQKII